MTNDAKWAKHVAEQYAKAKQMGFKGSKRAFMKAYLKALKESKPQ
jgi:hypothetical protein